MTITPNNRLVPLLFFCLFIFSIGITNAQTSKDTLVASQNFKEADSLLRDRKYNTSIDLFENALTIYQKEKVWEKVASCHNKISENQWKNSDFEKSILNAEKALEISSKYLTKGNKEEAYAYDNIGKCYEKRALYKDAMLNYQTALEIREKLYKSIHADIAKSYHNIAIIYYRTDGLNKTIEYFKKALDINIKTKGKNNIRNVASYNNLAIMASQLGDYDGGLEYCQKGLAILNTKKNKDNLYLSGVYNTIANLNTKLGNFTTALDYTYKSLKIREKEFQNHPKLALSYTTYGNLLAEKKEYKKALEYIEKAQVIYESKLGKSHPYVAEVYFYKGNIYTKLMQYSDAIKYYNAAIAIERVSFGEDHGAVITSYQKIGIAYQKMGDYLSSLKYYQKALDLYTNALGSNHPKVALMLNHIGELYFEQQEIKTALEYYLRAEKANSVNDIKSNTSENAYVDSNILVTTLKGKAKSLQKIFINSRDVDKLVLSVNTYKKMDTLINTLRHSLNNYHDKISYAQRAKEIYTEAIQGQLLYYNETGEQKYLESAVYYAEKSKSNTLKEMLSDSNAKHFSGLPVELIELEKKVKINRSFYQSKITEEYSEKTVDTIKIANYQNKLFDVNKKQDSITQVLERNYPKYYKLKYNDDIVKVSDIQRNLGDMSTLLEFFTVDNVTYAFTVSKNNIGVKKLETPKLTSQIEELKKSIISKNITNFKQKAYALYNELIYPIKDKFVGDELIVIPDGELWHLNFELLLSQNDVSENAGALSYLFKEYAITYANSANLLFNSFKEKALRDEREECLAFSFSDSINAAASKNMSLAVLRDSGDDLPGTRKEIKVISDIIDGQYYFGTEANEVNFKKNATRYKILHLALHGEVDNENPENSKLFFTKSKDTIEDNLLYAHELFALDIPSELTVLSACNTGTGKIAKGEGIMSLGNAFQYAGTKSLLLSSWEVPDDTAPELMHYFYTNLKSGMNKGKALQQAKLKYLTTADRYHKAPFYWGGFYLVGDSAPIEFNTTSFWYWILGFCVLAILLIGLFYYRRKRI
ncbi:CHAT domain-containing protein [Aquimarina sp. AD10]|uniref:CHAT domain-containing protein n=1 Tax=Aquimarina sp. AD10 TaxID=1714849 RepID=UPI000E468E89|nr:CHAT domain-containing protein [Aquimarina sp. AD10]AXT62346.1 CHAT domain-containing protein [Aquimarina sp. AD10]RKM90458.1 CHAT domain-containing protein [Aquimarina sp. AD10]